MTDINIISKRSVAASVKANLADPSVDKQHCCSFIISSHCNLYLQTNKGGLCEAGANLMKIDVPQTVSV